MVRITYERTRRETEHVNTTLISSSSGAPKPTFALFSQRPHAQPLVVIFGAAADVLSIAVGRRVTTKVSTAGLVLTTTSAERTTVSVSMAGIELVLTATSPLNTTTKVCFHVNFLPFLENSIIR
jgi:hypothetical protein